MTEEQMDNDIDDIFREALKNTKTEPPKEFWYEAAENIISRNNKPAIAMVYRWKRIALTLMVLIGVMSFFTVYFYAQSRNNNNTRKLSSSGLVLNKTNTILNTKTKQETNATMDGSTKSINTSTTENNPTIIPSTKCINRAENLKSEKEVTGTRIMIEYHTTKRKQIPPYYLTNAAIGKHTTGTPKNSVPSSAQTERETNTAPSLLKIDSTMTMRAPFLTSWFEIEYVNQSTNNTIPLLLTREFIQDSLIQVGNMPTVEGSLPWLSVSVFFAPDAMGGDIFKGNGSYNELGSSQLNNNENTKFSYSIGIKAKIPLSSHFSILAGLSYNAFKSSFNQEQVYYQQRPDGSEGYAAVTSSGITDCPYYGKSRWGDSLLVNGTISRDYLGIPIQIKYNITPNKKMYYYITGGGSVNFAMQSSTTMYWQDFSQNSGTAVVNSMSGLNNIYYSYYLGIGASYKLCHNLSIYAEPAIQGGITPITKGSLIISYPYSASLSFGATYSIR